MNEQERTDIERAIGLVLDKKDYYRSLLDPDFTDNFDEFIQRINEIKDKLVFESNRFYDTLLAALEKIESQLNIVMWNINQRDYEDDNPFRNTGNIEGFKNDVFEVHAYYWGDDEELIYRPNFQWRNVKISWYKHVGRGLFVIEGELTEKTISIMLEECLESLRKIDD